MYLSQIKLRRAEGGRGSLAKLLAAQSGSYDAHRLVWGFFGDTRDRERDFLYRLDNRAGDVTIHALSTRKPSDETGLFTIDVRPAPLTHPAGAELEFLLVANAVKTRKGQRHDIVLDRLKELRAEGEEPKTLSVAQEQGHQWLKSQGCQAGFAVIQSSILTYGQQTFKSPRGAPIKHAVMELTGRLRVTDPDAFSTAVGRGFGKAKAYGCGLMLLKPAA